MYKSEWSGGLEKDFSIDMAMLRSVTEQDSVVYYKINIKSGRKEW